MSYQTNPQSVTTNALITLKNPGTVQSSAPPVAVQVQNASGWILTVQGSGTQVTLQPFTAGTIAIATGQNVLVTPSFNAYPSLSSGYVSAEWLISHEQPAQPDGPLTSAATVAAISGSVTTQPPLNGVLYSGNFPTPKLSVANAGALGMTVTCGLSFNVSNSNHTFKITWFAADQTTVLFTETWNQFASPGGNGPFSTLLDIFPVFGPFFQVTSTAGNGPATIVVWATNLAGSFERPSPQTYLTMNGAAMGAGVSLSFELGTGGQTTPANVALSPDSFYVPGDLDIYAQINTGSGIWQVQELITQSGTFVIKQAGALPSGTSEGPIRFTIGRNTPLFVLANTSGVAGTGFADLSAVRGNG